MPGYIIQYFDETGKVYKEVTTSQPLPVTAIGSGTGGAEEVEVTQPLPAGTNVIGKVEIEEGGKTVNVFPASVDTYAQADNMLMTGSHMLGLKENGTEWARLRLDASFNLKTMINAALPTGTNTIGNVNITNTNTDGTALASLARTATTNSADLTNGNGKGGHIVLDVTATAVSPSVTLKIQGKDVVSGKYYDILESAAVTAIGTTVIKVHPGLTVAANSVANDIIPHTWRVVVTHSNTDSIQYSVGYSIV